MALKGLRNYNDAVDISFFMNATGERGGIVVAVTGGSGTAMDSSEAVVAYPTGQAPSGTIPVGLLLNDMVNYDLTKRHINKHKDEMQVGGKCTVLRRGMVVTNLISGDPTAHAKAYYDEVGHLTATDVGSAPSVGRFLSTKDADGYAKVEINII
jgi:hypothetical protein